MSCTTNINCNVMEVRLLCSGDGEHHWHVVNNWHVNPTGYGWEGFSQHFRYLRFFQKYYFQFLLII